MFEDVAVDLKRSADTHVDLKRSVDTDTLLKDALRPRRRGPWKVYHPASIMLPANGQLVTVAERFDTEEREVLGKITVCLIVSIGITGWQGWVRGVALDPTTQAVLEADGCTWEEFIEIGKALVDQALGPDE